LFSSNHAVGRWLVISMGFAVSGSIAAACGSSDEKRTQPREATGGAGGDSSGGQGGAIEGGGGAIGNAGGEAVAGNGAGGDGKGEGGSGGTGAEAGAAGGTSVAGQAGAGGDGGGCDETTDGSKIVIEFDPNDAERVTNLRWAIDDTTLTENFAAAGGQLVCNDPLEFFGQSYGAEATLPAPIVAGNLASLTWCGREATITSAAMNCSNVAQFPVTTKYRSYDGAHASQLRVTRTFDFGGAAAVYPQKVLRAHVARVPLAAFPRVIYPNGAGTAVTEANPGSCPSDCIVQSGETWNGRWFANVNPDSGLAMIVLRDPTLTSPVALAINNDALSSSNITSFMLIGPEAGWTEPLTETQYLCFASITTWPQAQRDDAQLPAGCGP
jgi:hypothetical protein